MTKHSKKRARFIQAARALIHKKGFGKTTLANIAELAQLHLGNIYYHFKTKEEIGQEVIKALSHEYAVRFEEWDQASDHKTPLFSFLAAAGENLEPIIQFGCPVGGLCQELAKQDGILANLAAKILDDLIGWCDKQFQSLGFPSAKASSLAQSLVSKLQGTYLLANTFKDPTLVPRQIQNIQTWLEGLILVQGSENLSMKDEMLLQT